MGFQHLVRFLGRRRTSIDSLLAIDFRDTFNIIIIIHSTVAHIEFIIAVRKIIKQKREVLQILKVIQSLTTITAVDVSFGTSHLLYISPQHQHLTTRNRVTAT